MFELRRNAAKKKAKRDLLAKTVEEAEDQLGEIEANLLGSVDAKIKSVKEDLSVCSRTKREAEFSLQTSRERVLQAELSELTLCVDSLAKSSTSPTAAAAEQLAACERELAGLPSREDLEAEREKAEERVAELRRARDADEVEAAAATTEIKLMGLRLNQRLQHQARLKSAGARKLAILRETNEDAYKYVCFCLLFVCRLQY